MAKIGTKHIRVTAKDGTVLAFTVQPKVDSTGIFSVELPDELIDAARLTFGADGVHPEKYQRALEAYGGPAGASTLTAKRLDDLTWALYELSKMTIEGSRHTQLVILARVHIEHAFWIDENGEINPRGRHDKPGRWWEPQSKKTKFQQGTSEATDTAGFKLAAWVARKVTTTRGIGTTVVFEVINPEELEQQGFPKAALLNSWISFRRERRIETAGPNTFELPFTEANAGFLHETFVSMARVSAEVDAMFASTDSFARAVAAHQLREKLPFKT